MGEHRRAMVYAVADGEESRSSTRVMSCAAEAVVNQIDLLSHPDFRLDDFLANLAAVQPRGQP